jgi:hypothetical protein
MRTKDAAIVVLLGLLLAGGQAWAQDLPQTPDTTPYPAPDIYIPPIVWNGNAIDQKILDAQAEMVPLHHPVRQPRHHHRG